MNGVYPLKNFCGEKFNNNLKFGIVQLDVKCYPNNMIVIICSIFKTQTLHYCQKEQISIIFFVNKNTKR